LILSTKRFTHGCQQNLPLVLQQSKAIAHIFIKAPNLLHVNWRIQDMVQLQILRWLGLAAIFQIGRNSPLTHCHFQFLR